MIPLVSPELDRYLLELLPARDPVIAEMEAAARERDIPIVGPAVATLLATLAESIGARRVFELGSAIGYSTAFFARAVGPAGRVLYTDGSEKNRVKPVEDRGLLEATVHARFESEALAYGISSRDGQNRRREQRGVEQTGGKQEVRTVAGERPQCFGRSRAVVDLVLAHRMQRRRARHDDEPRDDGREQTPDDDIQPRRAVLLGRHPLLDH